MCPFWKFSGELEEDGETDGRPSPFHDIERDEQNVDWVHHDAGGYMRHKYAIPARRPLTMCGLAAAAAIVDGIITGGQVDRGISVEMK